MEEEAKSGNYGNTSEFFRDLLRQRKKERAQEKLEALLLEGLNSGEPTPVTPEFVRETKDQLIARYRTKKQK